MYSTLRNITLASAAAISLIACSGAAKAADEPSESEMKEAMLKQLNEPVGDTKNAAPITIKFFKKQGCDAPTPRGYNCFFTMQVVSTNAMAQMFNNVPSSVFHKEGGKWEAYPPF
jgi:hypothetical protein